MEFMALDMVKHDQTFLVCSFQHPRISQAIIHPDRQMGLGELVVHFDFQRCWRNRGSNAALAAGAVSAQNVRSCDHP